MKEELGIIKNIHFGMRDADRPILWFEVSMLGGGTIVVMEGTCIEEFVQEAGCYKIEDLNGKPCVVEIDRVNRCKFVRLHRA